MKLWIDDIRPAPPGYFRCRSVNEAKEIIKKYSNRIDFDNNFVDDIEIIDIDHDAGIYAGQGGDYIKLLDWFEETGRNYPVRIHSMNPVGIKNMRAIIQRNNWKEIL